MTMTAPTADAAPRIFVCGEALIDFLPAETALGPGFAALPGGSPFNIAKAAARAGAESHFLGALSRDMFGDRLLADLQAHGVHTALTPRSDAPSMLAFVDMSGGHPAYAFFDRGSAAVTMTPTAEGIAPRPGDILCVGSISLLTPPAADTITRFATDRSEAMMLAIDPNVRANMIRDRPAWEARLDALFEASTIIKISDEDLAHLRPGQSAVAFAADMLRHGAELVVVTEGAKGAFAFSSAAEAHCAAPAVTVADTVGAGDTFMGNLLAGVQAEGCRSPADVAALESRALDRIVTAAAFAAALNCTRPGCQPPMRTETEAAVAAGRIG